ncbi:tRNA-binding protein [soil metagenome]
MATIEDFLKIDMRVGKVLEAQPFPEARKPAYKLTIDFGAEIGIKRTSAQITQHYTAEALVGKLVIAVFNFPPRQIGKFMSEVLVLGLPAADGHIILIEPQHDVPLGGRVI